MLGVRPGLQKSARRVVVSAHYDHIRGCEGADDNASGVAALLELSRVLAQARFANDLVIAFWDEEERGLLGSRAYSARARSRAEQIVGAYSLDAVGFASKKPRSQRVPAGFDALFPEHKALLEQRQYAADFIAVVGNGAARPLLESVQRQARVAGLPLMSLELSSLQGLLLRDAYRSGTTAAGGND